MFTKLRNWIMFALMLAMANPVFAQTSLPEDGEIAIELPFDPAPFIAAVLALAVTVLLLVAGPKISLQFGMKVIKKVGGIFR